MSIHVFDACPVCKSKQVSSPKKELELHPYVSCNYCGLYFQPKPCEKVYEATHESPGNQISEHDKQVNYNLANSLYHNHVLKAFPNEEKLYHFDVGSKYPYFGSCMQKVAAGKLKSFGIDGIKEARQFGEELGVSMAVGNFEEDLKTWDYPEDGAFWDFNKNKMHVVSLIHCIEHLYKPLQTLRTIRSLMAEGGILFVRCPDSSLAGIESEFTESYYQIHPLIWCESAIYEALAQLKDCFVCYESYQVGRVHQKDYLLKAISKKPTIGSWYIAKNEERDLPKSLESIKGFSDRVRVHDTGSTDCTINKVIQFGLDNNVVVESEINLECSTQNEKGDWQLWSFGEARNKVLEKFESRVDWLLWMDADDTITEEAATMIRRAPYMPYDIHGFLIKTGLNGHIHHRLWRSGHNIRFHGACHEYPHWSPNLKVKEHNDLCIVHNGADGVGEGSIQRNMRILAKEAEKPDVSSRTLFYLANTYRDAFGIPTNTEEQKLDYGIKAIETYDRYISVGGTGYHDELMHAYFYKARVLRFMKEYDRSIQVVEKANKIDGSWAELYMEAVYSYYAQKNYEKAIPLCKKASTLSWSQRLFSEREKYQDQPLRLLSWCYYNLCDYEEALVSGELVYQYVDKDDSWRNFLDNIKAKRNKKKIINLHRPGAIGDIIVTSSLIDGLQDKYPDYEIHYCTKYPEVAQMIESVSRVFTDWDKREHGVDFNLIGYPVSEGYPDKPMTKHLAQYFAEEVGVEYTPFFRLNRLDWEKLPCVKLPPCISWSRPHEYITVHVKTGWSKYKEWKTENWQQLIDRLWEANKNTPMFEEIFQIGTESDPKLVNCTDFRGKTSIAESCSFITYAKLHLGVDSFSNHVAGAFATPAVILFGSTSPIGSGYPSATNIYKGLDCQPCYKESKEISAAYRGECSHHKCMDSITVEEVLTACINLLT